MPVNMHIKIDSIDGSSEVDGFTNQIQLSSFQWDMTQTTTFQDAQGGGAGKVMVDKLKFTHRVDKSTPKLMLACSTGQHIKEAILTCRKVDGKSGVDFLKITLTDVIVARVRPASVASDTPVEDVELSMASYKVEYQDQDNTGAKKGGVVEAAFSIQKNKQL